MSLYKNYAQQFRHFWDQISTALGIFRWLLFPIVNKIGCTLSMIFIFWFALGKQWIVWLSLSASQYCAELSPASAYSPLLKGLVCGVSLNPSSETTLLREYSLTHLIVVSGSHFVLLENIINLLGLGRWATFICWFFNIATGFQAPGTRAVVEMSLRKFFKKNSLFYPPEFSVLISFIICLLFFPEWGKSFSFFLSTLCAWILSLSLDPLPKFLSAAFKVFFLYIIFSVFLFDLEWRWDRWLMGATMTLAISSVVFPVALLSWVVSPLVVVFDFIWRWVFWILSGNPTFAVEIPYIFQTSVLIRWLILLTFSILISSWNQLRRRKQWN